MDVNRGNIREPEENKLLLKGSKHTGFKLRQALNVVMEYSFRPTNDEDL